METHETKQDQVEMLIRYLTRGRDDLHVYTDKCMEHTSGVAFYCDIAIYVYAYLHIHTHTYL